MINKKRKEQKEIPKNKLENEKIFKIISEKIY